MGSEPKKSMADSGRERSSISIWSVAWNLLLLASIISTNLMALYSLSVSRGIETHLASPYRQDLPSSLLQEITSIREELLRTQRHLLKAEMQMQADEDKPSLTVGRSLLMSSELLEYTEERNLPLGRNPTHGAETMVSSIGHACFQHMDLLDRYMNYSVGELCPDDWNLAQALMVRGCEPLPRRRCFARSPPSYSSPIPLPDCRWSTPPDDTIRWTHYSCKSFDCLNRRARESKGFNDCADIRDLIELKKGSIRIGLDIGGGTASFAFNEFIALRGLVPMFLTVGQRLPFFDNTLDLVHSMHVLSNWIPRETLEFLLYDIDRVLRPGGIFWLDRFFCTQEQLESTYAPMVEKLGYKKLKWVAGLKLDKNGIKNHEVYLSALLEKPVRQQALQGSG